MFKSFWGAFLLGAVLGVTTWNLLLALIFKPWRPRLRGLEGMEDWGRVQDWGRGSQAGTPAPPGTPAPARQEERDGG